MRGRKGGSKERREGGRREREREEQGRGGRAGRWMDRESKEDIFHVPPLPQMCFMRVT